MTSSKRKDDREAAVGLVGRRDFTRTGALGLALPVLDGLGVREAGGLRPPALLSVGFLRGSDQTPGLLPWVSATSSGGESRPRVVVPARSLAGGSENAGPLRMTVHGLYPAIPAGSRLLSAWLDLVVPPPVSSGEPLRFAAWSYASRPVPSASPGTSFRLPQQSEGISLLVETLEQPFLRMMPMTDRPVPWNGQSAPAGRRQRFQANFQTAGSGAKIALRPGVYLLGLASQTWSWTERLPGAEESPRTDLLSVVVSVQPDSRA